MLILLVEVTVVSFKNNHPPSVLSHMNIHAWLDSSDQRGSSPLAVSACSAYSCSAVWTAVVEALGLALDDAAMDIVSDKRSIKSSSRFSQDEMCYLRSMGSEKRECLRQFKRDLGKWSIRFGEDRKMKRCASL